MVVAEGGARVEREGGRERELEAEKEIWWQRQGTAGVRVLGRLGREREGEAGFIKKN